MGEVYRADDLKLSQPVALKFLPDHLLSDGAALARFYKEVSVARQISHRHVCRVYDIAEYQGEHFLSMEYVRGEELSSLLKRIGRVPQDKAVDVARHGGSATVTFQNLATGSFTSTLNVGVSSAGAWPAAASCSSSRCRS